MKIGYARVSTEGQNLALQIDALRASGCTKIYREKRTGSLHRRPVLDRALEGLRAGDVLMVWKLDRLGRSFRHLLQIIGELESRGIGFHSVSDNIDTTSPGGKLLFHIIGAIAEFERTLISERTKAGMLTARRNGSRLGRPRALSDSQMRSARRVLRLKQGTVAELATQFNVGETTIRRALANQKA